MEKIKGFFTGLKSRLDFNFRPITILPLLIILLTLPACLWLPVEYSYENCLIENFQLIIILAAFIICIKAKNDKTFFNTLALVMVILFLREINCGRTVFFHIPGGGPNDFYSWKQIPYGYLAHPIYGAFMAFSGLYFILTESYKPLWNYFLKAKISIYNWVFVIIGIVFGLLGEEWGMPMLEEMTETLFYTSLLAIIFLQAQNKEYIETTKAN